MTTHANLHISEEPLRGRHGDTWRPGFYYIIAEWKCFGIIRNEWDMGVAPLWDKFQINRKCEKGAKDNFEFYEK